jgi:transposase
MSDKLNIEQRLRQINTRLKNGLLKCREEIKGLRKTVKEKDVLIKELSLQLKEKESQRQNLQDKLYKSNRQASGAKPLGKKPGAPGYHRPRPKDTDVTEEVKYIPDKCPYCRKHDLLPSQKEIIKYQEDIIILPEKIVKKYTIAQRWCPHCKEYVRSNKIPLEILDLERIGPNVTGYVLYARYRLRLPFNKIKQSLSDLHNFHLSEGEISNQLEKAKEIFKEDYETVIELIRISDKVYCDETGWRVRGKNFWIWVFVTEEGVRYVIEDTRGKGVAEKALGDNENRVLISDFYAAYKNLPGENQYCWVHLLRDSKRSESVFHKDLKKAYAILKQELSKKLKERNYKRLDKLLGRISQKKYADENISLVQKLQKRIRKNKKELLTCLKYEGLLPENNTAERALRNSVVMRKIFGCSRSLKTAKIMEVNTSVIDTLLKQNPDKRFFEVILPKLRGETG